jgi:predicted phosphodiesterase
MNMGGISVKYAIFSDIHGNCPALEAALADAETQGAEQYIFLGDYVYGFPWSDEATETIRALDNAHVIRGNGEGYMLNLRRDGIPPHECEQFKPVYWAYRSLSKENLDYIASLPETAVIADKGVYIYLSHSMPVFYRSPKIDIFHLLDSQTVAAMAPFSREKYVTAAREAALSRPDVVADILALPEGFHLFGHNHKQFYMAHEGRVFVNPGSCGEACDWDAAASYTLLTLDGKNWAVDERRVTYDLNAVAEGFDSSGYSAYAPAWSDVMKRGLFTGKDYFFPFVQHVMQTGRKMGRDEFPVCDEVFREAVRTWDADGIYR